MWLGIKLAAGQRIAPMRHRQDQLGFDGAYHYRELFEAHPSIERGPDEDIEHHFNRLKAAEKIEPKLAATKTRKLGDPDPEYVPADVRQRQLGPGATIQDGMLYNRLLDKHPRVERRHDEDTSAHFERLKAADDKLRATKLRPAEQENPFTRDAPLPTPDWVRMRERPPATSPSGLPQRIPGEFTGDTEFPRRPAPGFQPGMPQRTPGDTFRKSPYDGPATRFAPEPPTRDEWVRGLADKGIYLNPDGSRMQPEDMVLPRRPLRSRDIWEPFTRPSQSAPAAEYTPRHRAAVIAFVKAAIDSGAHKTMIADDWGFHGDGGSGSWYQKTIGDKTHVIARDGNTWIHNHGPADGTPNEYGDPEMTGTPMVFDRLGDAVMHAKRGTVNVGFSAKPPSMHRLNSTWSDEG